MSGRCDREIERHKDKCFNQQIEVSANDKNP